MNPWDDPELRPDTGNYVKFEAEGDEAGGTILAIRKQRFDLDVMPQILFKDDATGEERSWTVGQIQARAKLYELRPNIGDRFRARLTRIEKRGAKTLKHIDIQVTPGQAERPPF